MFGRVLNTLPPWTHDVVSTLTRRRTMSPEVASMLRQRCVSTKAPRDLGPCQTRPCQTLLTTKDRIIIFVKIVHHIYLTGF